MNIDLKGVLTVLSVAAGLGYFFLTGEQPPQPWKLFDQDEQAVILVGRSPDLVSNDLSFMVGEHLHFHLKTEGYVPHYVEWKFEDQLVAKGIRLDTSDIDDIDLEALQRQAISEGGFRIDAVFINDKNEYDSVSRVIEFRERYEPPRRQASSQSQRGRSNEQDEPTGSISYKGDEVIGNNNDICTLNTHNVAYGCPE